MTTDRCKAPLCGRQLGLALTALTPPAVPGRLILHRLLTHPLTQLTYPSRLSAWTGQPHRLLTHPLTQLTHPCRLSAWTGEPAGTCGMTCLLLLLLGAGLGLGAVAKAGAGCLWMPWATCRLRGPTGSSAWSSPPTPASPSELSALASALPTGQQQFCPFHSVALHLPASQQ